MGIITWQNVPVPNLDANSGLRTASDMFARAAAGAEKTTAQVQAIADAKKKADQEIVDRALLDRMLSIQTPEAYSQAMAEGQMVRPYDIRNASADMLLKAESRQDELRKRSDAEYKSYREQEGDYLQDRGSEVVTKGMEIAVNDLDKAFGYLQNSPDFRNMRQEDKIKAFDRLIKAYIPAEPESAKLSASLAWKKMQDERLLSQYVLGLESRSGAPDAQAEFSRNFPDEIQIAGQKVFKERNGEGKLKVFATADPTQDPWSVPEETSDSTPKASSFRGKGQKGKDKDSEPSFGGSPVINTQNFDYDSALTTYPAGTVEAAAKKGIQQSTPNSYRDILNYGDKILTNGVAKSSASGPYQIVNSTRRLFGKQALGDDWEKTPPTPESEDKFAEAILTDRKKGGLQHWNESLKHYAGLQDPETFRGLSARQILPTLARIETNSYPPDYSKDISVAASALEQMKSNLPTGARVLDQMGKRGLSTTSTVAQVAESIAKELGVKPDDHETLGEIITTISKQMEKAGKKTRISPAEVGGLILESLQEEPVFSFEDIKDGLDIRDNLLNSWVKSQSSALKDLSRFKETEEKINQQKKLLAQYQHLKREANAKLDESREMNPKAGRAAVLAFSELKQLSQRIGRTLDGGQGNLINEARPEPTDANADSGPQAYNQAGQASVQAVNHLLGIPSPQGSSGVLGTARVQGPSKLLDTWRGPFAGKF